MNNKRLKVNEVIIVEGKYDKIKLSNILDALIIDVGGFCVFKDHQKLEFIKKMTMINGAIIFTDSDASGFMIRNYLRGILPKDKVKHAYIPDIYGKEKRKTTASKEGKIGVEGVDNDLILKIIQNTVDVCRNNSDNDTIKRKITKLDLYRDGFSGRDNSAALRVALLRFLGLPERLSSNAMVDVLNRSLTYEDYLIAVREIIDASGS